MKKLYFFVVCLFIYDVVHAQDFMKVITGTDKNLPFKEIAKKINHYFDTLSVYKNKENDKESEGGGYTQWKRMEWFAMHHLGPDGRVENYSKKNWEVLQERNVHPQMLSNSNTPLSNYGAWTNIGYSGVSNGGTTARQGRVNCFGFNLNNGNVIYAGTAGGGIWKTLNGGASWFNITDGLPLTSFSGIAVHPNGNTIYALSGDGFDASDGVNGNSYKHNGIGVLKSNDAGATWKTTGLSNLLSSNVGGFKIKIHPSNPDIVLAALSNGLWRTTNGGTTWIPIVSNAVTDFEFKPGDDNILYYTLSGGNQIAKLDLTTLTLTYSASLTTAVGISRIEISVSAASPNNVYALVGPGYNTGAAGNGVPNGNPMYNGFYVSTDGGSNFSKRNDNIDIFALNNDQSWYDIVLQVNPGNSNDIVIGGVRTYRSTDGGINFSLLNTTNPHLHGDCHGLERSPVNGNIYLGDDGGIYSSGDNGATWVNITNGIVINEFYRISGFSSNDNLLMGGTQDNGQFIRSSATSVFFGGILGLDGMDNIIDHTNANVMYACIQNGGLNKSVNGGASFVGVGMPAGTSGNWVTPIIQSPAAASSGTIYYGANTGILRTTNGGAVWANIGGQTFADCFGIGTDGTNFTLYTSKTSFMSRCNNPLAAAPAWVSINTPNTAVISAIAVNPANKNEIWFSCSGYSAFQKVYRSLDAGATWANLSLSLPNIPVHSIAFANNTNAPGGAIYVGTESGVFYTDDGIPDWEPFYNGLPMTPVTDLFVNYNSGNVTAATYGRGLWRSDAYNSCPGSYSITGTSSGKKFYQSAGSIDSYQTMVGSVGNELRLRAAVKVTLKDGFRAYNGSYLHAVIGPCGSGVVSKQVEADTAANKTDSVTAAVSDKK
jgi:hypothetical protein